MGVTMVSTCDTGTSEHLQLSLAALHLSFFDAQAGSMSMTLAALMGTSIFKHNLCSTFKQLLNMHKLDTLHTALLKQARHGPFETALQ